jgi:hypothetical protein
MYWCGITEENHQQHINDGNYSTPDGEMTEGKEKIC